MARYIHVVLLLALAGCGGARVLTRANGAPIHILSISKFNKACATEKEETGGCADCEGNRVYIRDSVKEGTAEFMRLVRHEDDHLKRGCSPYDHCNMEPGLLGWKDMCDAWKAILGVIKDEPAKKGGN